MLRPPWWFAVDAVRPFLLGQPRVGLLRLCADLRLRIRPGRLGRLLHLWPPSHPLRHRRRPWRSDHIVLHRRPGQHLRIAPRLAVLSTFAIQWLDRAAAEDRLKLFLVPFRMGMHRVDNALRLPHGKHAGLFCIVDEPLKFPCCLQLLLAHNGLLKPPIVELLLNLCAGALRFVDRGLRLDEAQADLDQVGLPLSAEEFQHFLLGVRMRFAEADEHIELHDILGRLPGGLVQGLHLLDGVLHQLHEA
mmetsp:Transcript_15971/g.46220  ORF Transcript_15971/g.46220 Transcript_15971/m.46220 type:complete len:247 (+) Transcript_15971:93-833(+)